MFLKIKVFIKNTQKFAEKALEDWHDYCNMVNIV